MTGGLPLAQPDSEANKALLEVAEAARTAEKRLDEEERPAVADAVERGGERGGERVVLSGRRLARSGPRLERAGRRLAPSVRRPRSGRRARSGRRLARRHPRVLRNGLTHAWNPTSHALVW